MSFVTSCSFIFNGKNSYDYGVIIGWISDIDVSVNGLTRDVKKIQIKTELKQMYMELYSKIWGGLL